MTEELVFGLVFGGWALLNLCGEALYHALYRKAHPNDDWRKDGEFILMSCFNVLLGICYLGLKGMTAVVMKIRGIKDETV